MGRMHSSEKSMSSSVLPVEQSLPPASVEMTNAEVKSRKRRKRRKIEWGDASDGDIEWAKSLSDCQLDLMVSVKQLAMERVRSTREKSLNGLLTPAGLRTIGIILEEFMMDRVQTLRNAPAGPSSVIDDLRACIENSEDECNETNHVETAVEADEGSYKVRVRVRVLRRKSVRRLSRLHLLNPRHSKSQQHQRRSCSTWHFMFESSFCPDQRPAYEEFSQELLSDMFIFSTKFVHTPQMVFGRCLELFLKVVLRIRINSVSR